MISNNPGDHQDRPTPRRRPWRRVTAFLVALAALAALVGEASANGADLAPDRPRRDLPVILDGQVWASVLHGDVIVAGGTFTEVRTVDGRTVQRRNLVAFHADTGALVPTPVVNGEVIAVEVATDGSGVFLGGAFSNVGGEPRQKVAKLTPTLELDTTFRADANAKVQALADDGDLLYVGGNFTMLSNQPRVHFGAVDMGTGHADDLVLNLSGPLGKGDSGAVRALDVHPDGNLLLIAHTSTRVGGAVRVGVAMVDLDEMALSPWRTNWFQRARLRCSQEALQIRDAEFSPDGSYFVVVEKGNNGCDKAIAFPTERTGRRVQNLWVAQMFDSTFSVGITEDAVYVGGHFCFTQTLGPIRSGQVSDYEFEAKPEKCDPSGNAEPPGPVAARYQIAALDPATGEALDWSPHVNAQVAVFDITVTERGLLIGQDRDRFNWFKVGRLAFLDEGPLPGPECSVSRGDPATVRWSNITGTRTFQIRVDGKWLATVEDDDSYRMPAGTRGDVILRWRDHGTMHDLPCN